MRFVYIKTLGCQMNEYDSDIILNVLKKSYAVCKTDSIQEADILILNTCSIREKVDEKIFSELGLWHKIKKNVKKSVICVGGCFAVRNEDFFLQKASFVNVVFGPKSLHKLPDMIEESLKTQKIVIDFSASNTAKFNYVYDQSDYKNKFSSCLTIMEGCSKYCSYCVVPLARGLEFSRSFNSIISELYTLAIQGVKEVVLLGQNVSSYSGIMDGGHCVTFSSLLNFVTNIEGLERIKFISAHPVDFLNYSDLSFIKNIKISSHLHLPVQSGSDKILKDMNRDYTAAEYRKVVYEFKKLRKNLTISTDIIVGFPGETDKDFDATLKLVSDMEFDTSFVYIYSPRKDTKSIEMVDDVSIFDKKYRLNVLNDLLLKQSRFITEGMIGSVQRVLIYKSDFEGCVFGKTDNNRIVVMLGDISNVGKVYNVFIEKKMKSYLYGYILK